MVDLSALAEAAKEGFLGFSLENGSTDYVTSVTMTDDITLYANYKEVVLPMTVFDFEDNTKQGWNVMNGGASSVTDGVYKVAFDTQKSDAWLYNEKLSLDANTLRYVVVKMRHNIPQARPALKSWRCSLSVPSIRRGRHICVLRPHNSLPPTNL